jgi:hypothetical protein
MPVKPGMYPAPKQESEVLFEHPGDMPPAPEPPPPVTERQEDDLVILEPTVTTIKVQHEPSPPAESQGDLPDPYNLDHYLLTSAEGFSPFEQNLGIAPFKDLHGEEIWAGLAYTEDGSVHPCKVFILGGLLI